MDDISDFLCRECRENPPVFKKAAAPTLYDDIMKKVISEFKYNGRTYVGKDLANLIVIQCADFLKESFPELIMHIPLHEEKLKERGYDQAYILAVDIGKHLKIPVIARNLERIRQTQTQTHLHKKERAKNVKGAFQISHAESIKGRRILLVDDVYTTGATIRECAKSLNKAGAGEIFVVTAARA